MMNVIVRQRPYNRPFTVNMKWLQQIIELNWSISQLPLIRTPEEHMLALFFFCPVSKTQEIQLQLAQLTTAFCFCFNEI